MATFSTLKGKAAEHPYPGWPEKFDMRYFNDLKKLLADFVGRASAAETAELVRLLRGDKKIWKPRRKFRGT
ncbi:MAG: hypothetical protein NVS9B14_06570 [Candidatus Acidiferrum sp.]